MENLWIPYIFMLLTGYVYIVETTSCSTLERVTACRYTILCEHHSGSVSNPTCEYEPYVTFRMVNSNEDYLNTGFFGATNFDSRVRAFTAINNTWRSITPSTFRYYTKTIEMNLSGNHIREVQEEAFKSLFKLKHLNLSLNFIETIYSKTFLTLDIRESELEVIDLSHNSLMRIDSNAFSRCPHLKELYFQYNNIANLEDNVFNNLQNLTRLYLDNNKLTQLNMTLITLKQLKYLDLSHNVLTKLSGFEINRLTSLEWLNISFNDIEFIESNCFSSAFNLVTLDLRSNKIKSTIANLMFINNGKLIYLNLYNNSISKIQEGAFENTSLLYINLEKNFISGEITETSFAGLQRIGNLNLWKQNITALKANAFKDMTNLVNLSLSANKINIVDQSSFKNTIRLAVLDLSHNNIAQLNFFKDALTNLTELYLNNNKITLIPAYTFINQTLLRKLDISMNKIITIGQYSLPLCNLQYVNISGNLLTGPLKSNVLSPAKYLRYLDLSNFNITRIENMALIDLPVLARLNLSHNVIEFIGPKNFINLTNMFSLDLSNNRLPNVAFNNISIKNLSALYLNNNNLNNITGVIPNATMIMYLDISYNNITDLTGAAIETLRELRVLRAASNKIKKFNNPQINLLSKLNDLDLSSNQISEINLRFYKDLVRVDISNNSLNYVNSSLLENLKSLQVLNIYHNNINVIPPGVFQNAEVLRILNVSSNNLNNLRYGSLKGLESTKVIDLSRNKLTQMDVDVFHECKELVKLIIDYNHIKQLDVEQLINAVPKLTSLSLGGNPLDCKQIVRNIRNINKHFDRSVEITSIHKIFHEDNVYGIRCGDVDTTIPTMPPANTTVPPIPTVSSALVIWCSVLSVLFLLLFAVVLIWKRHYIPIGMSSQRRLQLGRSVELSGSEFQNDLLT